MKNLLILLIVAAAIQLSVTAPATPPTTIEALAPTLTHDKRYQLFDSYLLKLNNITSNLIVVWSSIYPDLLRDYNEWFMANKEHIPRHKLEHYQELKDCLVNITQTMEELKKDRQNCVLERKLQQAAFNLEATKLVHDKKLNDEEFNQIWEKHTKNTSLPKPNEEEITREFYDVYFDELKAKVEHFVQSLDDIGKEENKVIAEWSKEFQSANTRDEKEKALSKFEDLLTEEVKRETEAGNVNCRLLVHEEFIGGLVVLAIIHAIDQYLAPKPKNTEQSIE